MSKIEEMAEDYSFISEGTDVKGEIYKDYNSYKYEGFIDGANAVLEVIEKVLVAACEQYTSKQAVALNTEIYNKIKELKED